MKPVQLEMFDPARITQVKKRHFSIDTPINSPKEPKFPSRLSAVLACSIILLVVSFVLGVEKGKIITKVDVPVRHLADADSNKSSHPVVSKVRREDKSDQRLEEAIVNEPIEVKPLKEGFFKKKLEKSGNDDIISNSTYIIQVATYKRNSSYGKKAVSTLKQSGYDTTIINSGDYMQVCAGKFITKRDAKQHLSKLQKTYKDCFLRKI